MRTAVLLWAGCWPLLGSAEEALPVQRFEPARADIYQLQVAMGTGKLTARELVEYYLGRIEAMDPLLNSVARINPDAIRIAELLDAERAAKGPRGPLHGIPLLIKDNYQTAGLATTAGSLLLNGFQPAADAYQIAKLRAAGAVILGKTNMHEFALGITAQGSGFGRSRNPYAPARTAGDGLAAALAADLASAGMGTDTCGSLRLPAAHNGLYGLRSTQGLASRSGIVPVSHTQDVAGPLARNVSDLALLLDATVGFDSADRQSAAGLGQVAASYFGALNPAALQGARIGVLEDLLLQEPEDAEVAGVAGAAFAELQAAGARLERIKAPELIALMDSRINGFLVLEHEFKTDLEAYLRAREGAPVTSLAEILGSGEYDPSIDAALRLAEAMDENSDAEYLAELHHRDVLRQVVLAVMADNALDALAYPASRRKAAALGEPQPGSNCRLSANTGLPAIVIPAGVTADGLPVGLELLGPAWSESRLLNLAYSYQQATGRALQPASGRTAAGPVPRRVPSPEDSAPDQPESGIVNPRRP